MEPAHCPQTGKIYTIIMFCLVLSGMLTSVNVLSRQDPNQQNIDDTLFGTGIAINVIQTMFTLFLLYIDLGGSCKESTMTKKGCKDSNCKWVNIAPPDLKNRTWSERLYGYLYILIVLLSSSYLLGFGITMIMKSNDSTDKEEITTLSITSGILGAMGILFIMIDLLCMIGCWC